MEKLFDIDKIEARLKEVKTIDDLTGKDGIINAMLKTTVERLLKAELDSHLGFPANDRGPKNTDNRRNGTSSKTMKTGTGAIDIDIPRDREGTFEPKLIEKHRGFDSDFERKIISMYAKGMSVRDMCQHLSDLYGAEVSPALISAITNKVMGEMSEWHQRPLERVYPIVFLDAFFYKTRIDNKIVSKACYSVLGITLEGKSDILGIWVAEGEGAHFWLQVLSDLKNRGVEDILIACVDGLKGFPEAIATAFPKTIIQQCIVHQIRTTLRFIASADQKKFLVDLKTVYKAPTRDQAMANLLKIEECWPKYKVVVDNWIKNWDLLTAYFDYPEAIRRIIYTTNIVEGFHRRVRKITKTKSIFPTDDSIKKLVYLIIKDIDSKDRTAKKGWGEILCQLQIMFADRIPAGTIR
jgi:transposase-like protein